MPELSVKKPTWQRARIINADDPYSASVGHELWVQIGEPAMRTGRDAATGRFFEAERTYLISLSNGRMRCDMTADRLELLARDDDDFLYVDPPLIPWTEFLAQCQAASDRKRKDDHE